MTSILFIVASFASAFLIFLVQPMVGKRILPWFGGVPAVWTLCLAFYQVALFAGYAYAHGLIRALHPSRHLLVHGVLFALALLALPVLPGDAWRPAAGDEPSLAVLALLAANVAAPFVVLAATGPLVQAWFARVHPGRSPYPLYAVSNLGSLLALVSYPLLVEPRLALTATGSLWSQGFVASGVAVLACAALAGRAGRGKESPGLPPAPSYPAVQVALWLSLAGCAVLLLMGVTNELCLDVASVPFLWILPLTAYLVTFILAFGFEGAYRRKLWLWFTLAFLVLRLLARSAAQGDGGLAALASSVQVEIALQCGLLFGACMLLHGELYRLRPAPAALTRFYLCISGGGALGGLFAGLVAPRIFHDYHELPLATALGCLLLIAAFWNDSQGWLRPGAPRWRKALALGLGALALVDAGNQMLRKPGNVVHQERSFFGVLRVLQEGRGANQTRRLLHGTTLHGLQLTSGPLRPTINFGVLTGIGMLLSARDPAELRAVGVVGLGIGTLAAYGRPGDLFRYFEIDPAVIRIARDQEYFSYLSRSAATVEVVEGDGRIALERELELDASPRYDLLVIDAFSSVAIPVHLLTREALQVYLDSIRSGGLLAMNVSNRHFDLFPILARLGRDAGLQVVAIDTVRLPRYLSSHSSWVFLSRDAARIESLEQLVEARRRQLRLGPGAVTLRRPEAAAAGVRPWTDDYSDLLAALRPLPLRLYW